MDLLLQNFATLAGAPGGVPKLRELILSLAVRGSLVPNDPPSEIQKSEISNPPHPIPPSWRWVRNRDVTHDLGQSVPKKRFTYIDVGSIDNARGVVTDGAAIVEASDAPSRARKIVQKGTVIYSTVRPYLRNVAVLDRNYEPEPIASTAFAVLHPKEAIVAHFLHYYLRSVEFTSWVTSQMSGMAYPAINDAKMSVAPIPLPPLPEQHRIVAKVDELMALCDALEARQEEARKTQAALTRSALHHLTAATDPAEFSSRWNFISQNFQSLEARPENVADLRRAILQLAVMGKLSAASDWETVPLAELGVFVGGSTPSKAVSEYWTGNIPWVSPKDMKVTHIADSIDHISTAAVENSSVKLLPPGAILMVVRGMILAHSFPVAVTTTPVTLNQDMKGLVLHEPKNAEYLLMALRGLRDGALALVARSSHGTCRIDTDKLRQFSIPMPPQSEQDRIVAKVDELMKLCDGLEAGLTRERADADRLFDAVVAGVG